MPSFPPLRAAPEGIGEGGQLLEDSAELCSSTCSAAGATASGGVQSGEVLQPVSNVSEATPAADSGASWPGSHHQAGPRAAAAASSAGASSARVEDFLPAAAFQGAKAGFVFKLDEAGLGYYTDSASVRRASPSHAWAAPAAPAAPSNVAAPGEGQPARGATKPVGLLPPGSREPDAPPPSAEGEQQGQPSEAAPGAAEPAGAPRSSGGPPPGPRHHWGQALQYLDRAVAVDPGHRLTVLAKRDGSKIRFALRQGVGEWVERAPWRVEWGGGASVENPHFQRVHYCELLVRAPTPL